MRTQGSWERRQRSILLLMAVLISVGWACDAPTSPSAPSAPTPLSRYRVSGIVRDAAGATPIPNATVTLRHDQGELTTRTDGNGVYEFSFDTNGPYRPPVWVVPGDTLGLLIVGDGTDWNLGEHWTSVQLLPWGAMETAHNVRLRPVRTLAAGQSMTLSIDADSSLKWDREADPWSFSSSQSFNTLWEEFLVSAPTDGVLTIDARPEEGGIAATLTCQYAGCSSLRAQGTVSLPVRAGSTLYFSVEIPRTVAPQRFNIQTSLH